MQHERVYTLTVDQPRNLTKQEALDMDKSQPWRKRIPSGAMDELNAMRTILLWADTILRGDQTAGLMKEMRAWQRARAGVALLKSAVEAMLGQVSAVQLRTLDANWQQTNVTLSAGKCVPGFVNVDIQALQVLINQTLVGCKEGFCMAEGRKSRECPVRQALDITINAGRAIGEAGADSIFDVCPYAMNKAESRII